MKIGMNPSSMSFEVRTGVSTAHGGVYICPGFGRHPSRIIDTWELIVVERGRLGMLVDQSEFDLGPGEWLLMPPRVQHRGSQDYPRELRFLWLHFRVHPGRRGTSAVVLPPSGRLADPVAVSALARRLIDHLGSSRPDPVVGDLLLSLLLADIAAAPSPLAAGDDLAARAMRIITARFREGLSTAMVAQALGVGADHLGRCFRRSYGQRVQSCIHQNQVREANRLLMLGGGRIGDVAAAVGFRDVQWFRRLFVREQGISPRAWRRLHARVHTNS